MILFSHWIDGESNHASVCHLQQLDTIEKNNDAVFVRMTMTYRVR